ncbi:MAG: hypothetical protein Q8N99_02930 [Nanoarchaeota archaeon]|nr:hypothetical protein [Nanoarchaeota archaeon]
MEPPTRYEGDYRGNEKLGKLTSMFVPSNSLVLSRLGNWYEANPHHKYNPGDILILNSRRRLGHGIRSVAVVESYGMREAFWNPYGVAGMYTVTVSRDVFGDDNIWIRENKIPRGVERITERNLVFKCNIEHRFKKVKCKNVEEALRLYKSIEVDPNSMGFTAEEIEKIQDVELTNGQFQIRHVSMGSGYPLDLVDSD